MRLTLVLMRHGEAEEAARGGDRHRVLTAAGRKAAAATGQALTELGLAPERAFASDAARTKETSAQVATAKWPKPVTFEFRGELYLTGITHVRKILDPLGADVTTVVVVGHNPGFSEAGTVLTGQYVALRPADAVVLAIDAGGWAEGLAAAGSWELVQTIQA